MHSLVGSGLLLVGVGLNTWALVERHRGSAGSFDLERPSELVTRGPYAFSRHPMYVGWWLIHLGAGTLASSSWMLVTLPIATLVEHEGVLREEAALSELFGDSYTEYTERVPRYVALRRRRPSPW
ncbi:methyltransferase family protein [Paenarthrobacter sp. NPDC092416]|uniref:methyltransferase family protein n=1 Tax=Paenarthrobacter sp. NPDC092416 TaxID=3364386 RepID=UPI003801CBC9